MRQNLMVSNKGQITLPASVRKRYGINGGSLLILEDGENGLSLTPAEAMPVEIYSDEQIAEWEKEYTFKPGERKLFSQQLKRRLAR